MELLPECDPRLFPSVPSTSIYFGANEAVKTVLENAVRLAAQTSLHHLQKDSSEIGKEQKTSGGDDVLQTWEDATEPEQCQKSRVKTPASQKTESMHLDSVFVKPSTGGSKRRRTVVGDNDDVSFAAESFKENLSQSRTGTKNTKRQSIPSGTKARTSRKRKRKDTDELSASCGYSFPSVNRFKSKFEVDEGAVSQRLPQLSFYAELDHNPEDPMLLISLCELDDITALQRQDFVSDLSNAYIGRKPRFIAVCSPYCDRTSSRIGQLSLQTYCDGHFTGCVQVSRVHLACLHQWALREPLEKVVCNVRQGHQKPALSFQYPSVRSLSDLVCSWLSDQLCCLMSDMGINCPYSPDIFIGASLPSDLTANCLYQMFCRYVDYLCNKAEKYFIGMDHSKSDAGRHTGRRVDSAARSAKRARLSKQTSPLPREKASQRQAANHVPSWKGNADYAHEDEMSSYLEECGLFEGIEKEQFASLHEKVIHSFDLPEQAVTQREGGGRKKHKLPKDFNDDYECHVDVTESKARRVNEDQARLSAAEKKSSGHVDRKMRDIENDVGVAGPTEQDVLSRYEDSPDLVVYDDDCNIVVQCSSTGRTVVVEEARPGDVQMEDTLKTAADETASSSELTDELCKSSHPLYGIVHDHCYTTAQPRCLEPSLPVAPDQSKDEHFPTLHVEASENSDSAPPVTACELIEAAKSRSAEVPLENRELADGKTSLLPPLSQLSSDKAQHGSEKAAEATVKERNTASKDSVPQIPQDTGSSEAHHESHAGKSPSQKTPGTQLDTLSLNLSFESTAKKIHPLSHFSVCNSPSVSVVSATSQSTKQPSTKKRKNRKRALSPQPIVEKEQVTDSQNTCDVSEKWHPKVKEKIGAAEILVESGSSSDNVSKKVSRSDEAPSSASLSDPKASVIDTVVFKMPANQSGVEPDLAKVENMPHNGSEVPAKALKVEKASDKRVGIAEVPFSYPKASAKDTVADKSEPRDVENTSNKVGEAPAKEVEAEKASDKKGGISDAPTVPVDKVVDSAGVSPEVGATATTSSVEALAAARAACHYIDAYISEMADAYAAWPSSNFDVAFDPTSVPAGHINPFRKTWPILQHVIDGKSDLLLKVFSFPNVNSFDVCKVMRENAFLWAVCLSLFDPVVSKPEMANSSLYSGIDSSAGNKVKGAKSSNPLMAAFRQAVEAKKKVAVNSKSKLAVGRQNSDDVWSVKRQVGKTSIVFGSAVKSGGSLSSVVGADQSSKVDTPVDAVDSLLISAIRNFNSDISDVIVRKCGKQCLDKGAGCAERRSLPAVSKHLSAMSDFTLDMYDMAEYKLVKIFADRIADKKAGGVDNDVENIKPAAVVISTAATTSVSDAGINVVSSSVSQLAVSTSSLCSVTPVNESVSADVRSTSALGQVPQPSVHKQVETVTCAASVSGSVAVASISVTVSCTTVTVTSVNVAATTVTVTSVNAAAPAVTATVAVSTVTDMLPPPMPPLSLSHFGVGFDLGIGSVSTSSGSLALTSWPSSTSSVKTSSIGQVSAYPIASTTGYLGGFAYLPPVTTQLQPPMPTMRVPPPPVPRNLYRILPPVGVPHPGFVDTSVPPPPLAARTPWYPSPLSAADGYRPVSCVASVSGSSAVPSDKATVRSSTVQNLQTSNAGDTSKVGENVLPVQSMATQLNRQQLKPDVSSVTYASPSPHLPRALAEHRPPTAMDVVIKPRTVFPRGSSSTPAPQGLVSSDSPRSFIPFNQGNRPVGPLKVVSPVFQAAASRMGTAVHQVRSVSSTVFTESTPLSPLQNSRMQLHGTLMGAKPTAQVVASQTNVVPVRPAAASQPVRHSGMPAVMQGPYSGVRSGLTSAQTAVPASQLCATTGQVRKPSDQPNAATDAVGQRSYGVSGPPTQPGGALPHNQPLCTVRPVTAKPSHSSDQPRAAVVVRGPHKAMIPRPPMNQSVQSRTAFQGGRPLVPVMPVAVLRPGQPKPADLLIGQSTRIIATRPSTVSPPVSISQIRNSVRPSVAPSALRAPAVCVESQVPSIPGPATQRPSAPSQATAAGRGVVGKGPLLTANSRVYVLNSDSSPLCKDVEVSAMVCRFFFIFLFLPSI